MERPQLKPFSEQDRADLAIRILPPKMAAEKLGLTVAAVMQRRTELGLPAIDTQLAQRSKRQVRARTRPA